MADTSGIQYAGGFRGGRIYELNAAGRIKGNSSTVPYMGIPIVGGKILNLTIPKQRRLNHIDADRVAAADFLPPTEAASAVINVGADNMGIDSVLTANKTRAVGEALSIGSLTSNQGFEPLVGLWMYQESLDAHSRLRRWRNFLVPRAKLIPMDAGMADREVDGTYDVLFTPSEVDLFGVPLTITADNETDEQYRRLMSEGVLAMAAWIGDGTVTEFTFPVGYTPAKTIGKVAVFVDGILKTTGITVTTTDVTFTIAPIVGADILIKWEF